MTTLQKTLITILILVVFMLVTFAILKNPVKQHGTDTQFTDSKSGISVTYPKNSRLITDTLEMSSIGYFPTCNSDTAVACVYFASSTYPRSNFNSAGVSVRIARELSTVDTCNSQTKEEQNSIGEVMIDDIIYKAFGTSDAGMSKQSGGINYRTFQNDLCYEITTRVNTTSYEVYDSADVSLFTDSQQLEIITQLVTIVSSVKIPR